MSKQALVIGLGLFGSGLARALARHGSEVMAVDIHEGHVDEIAPHVTEAILLDAMDEEALTSLSPEKRNICVCAIGADNREGSIVVTALLKQLGAKHIVARATDPLHARILRLVGAHEVVQPEQHFGERLAMRLAWRNIVNVLPLDGDLVLTEIEAPEALWGRTLAELDLPRRFEVNVAAIRRRAGGEARATIPDPQTPIAQGDILMLVSTDTAVHTLTEKL